MVGNYAGGLFNAGLSLGQILGPLFGATTYAATNFRVTQDIMALICIVFAILYFFCAEGRAAISQTFKRKIVRVNNKDQKGAPPSPVTVIDQRLGGEKTACLTK